MNLIRGIMEEALEYPGKPLKTMGTELFRLSRMLDKIWNVLKRFDSSTAGLYPYKRQNYPMIQK